jgi:mevalonate kinase
VREVKVFVPGKIILSGEHSVVYGYPALVASLSKGITVKLMEGKGKKDYKNDEIGLIRKAIGVAGGKFNGLDLKIESDLPVGAGLGSSAAIAAGVIKAVKKLNGKKISDEKLFDLTMECERLAHKNPSGVDPAAVIYGGLIKYIKNKGLVGLKTKKTVKFLLFDSGKPKETTGEMVELVEKRYKSGTKKVEEIFKKIWSVTETIQLNLEDDKKLKKLIDENGKLLESLGVVSKKVIRLSQDLRKINCGVKITGAGGLTGGSGMVLVKSLGYSKPKKFLEDRGYKTMEISIGD